MSGVVFDPSRAKVDSAYRTEAMELYKQGKLEISDNDLKWLNQIMGVSKDDNEYQIEDDEPNEQDKVKGQEKEKGQDNTKVVRNKGTDKAHGIVDIAVSGTAMGASAAIGFSAASGLSGASAQMAGLNSMATEIACLTAFAVGTKYEITRPNKDEHKELGTLKKAMETGDIELANSLIKLQESEGEVTVLRDEAEVLGEKTEEDIETKQEELEKKKERIDELKTKAQTEEGLTEEEKAELETLTGEVATLEKEIEDIMGKGTEDAEDKQGEIEEKQSEVDEANDVFNSVLEIANYAETFDEKSMSSATLEAVGQGVNAAMGFTAAAALTFKSPLLSLTPYGQILRGLALAGAGMSTHGTIEQAIFAKDIGDEINVRKNVQANGESAVEEVEGTTEAVEEGIENTQDTIDEIEDMTEDIPTEDPSLVPNPPVSEPEPPEGEDEDKDKDDKKDPSEV